MKAALRPYIRPDRDDVAVVREIHDATRALAITTQTWLAFLPRPAAVESARGTVAGLSRLLTELATLQSESRAVSP